jgi:hypothetical protein
MELSDFLEACIKLGIPMAALSWFLFSWLFGAGEIDREDDHKIIAIRLKKLKKSTEKREQLNSNYIYDKWMWFGSGFYGLAGLWTFAVIEISQFFDFIFDFPGLAELFEDGIVGLIFSLLFNQLENVLQAFVWFTYWPTDSELMWGFVAYLGYWIGVEMARRKLQLPVEEWLKKLSNRRP